MDEFNNPVSLHNGIIITRISLIANMLLLIVKCSLGIMANSMALLGDGLHSLLDMATDVMTLFGLKISQKPDDIDHHYGHHKFSSLSTLFIGAFLLFFCTSLIFTAVQELIAEETYILSWWIMPVTIISIITKEVLYWRTRKIARSLKSRVLMANAYHHRWDSFSSILLLIGLSLILILGSEWTYIDKVIGLLMGGYFGIQSLKLFKEACDDLLDRAPEMLIIHDLTEHVLPTPGALAYHKFRARRVGDMIEIDLHLQVDPKITVQAGHTIASKVKQNILSRHDEVLDILIHIEPAISNHLKEKGISEWSDEIS